MAGESRGQVVSAQDGRCGACGRHLEDANASGPEDIKSPEQFRVILDHMADMIAVIDANGKRLYNSPSYRRVLDDPQALQGTDSFSEIHPDDQAKLKQMFDDTMRTGVGRRAEYRFLRKDGSVRYIESQGDVIRDASGRSAKMVVVSRDITDRKHAEEEIRTAYRNLRDAQTQLIQSEKLASIGQFAAGIVHDLKNPLGIVLTGTELLLGMERTRDINWEVFAESIRLMRESVERANKMVQGLLSLSRREELKLTPEEMNTVVARAGELVKKEQPGANVGISQDLMTDAPRVLIDRDQMEQVLINLISNAIQAMPHGGSIRLATSMTRVKEGGPRVGKRITDFFRPQDEALVVEIADTGPGMPKETLEKIFEPFFTTKPRGQGTGLGLAIVRSIIEGHRGVVEATSQVGQGTTFRIILPIPSETATA